VLPELQAISAFSFLRASSDPEALVARAAALGLTVVALLDRDAALRWAGAVAAIFGPDDAVIELTRHQHRPEERRTQRLVALARHVRLRTVAAGDMRYARCEGG
jgi:DNA polymerase III alpha subunit